MALRPFFTEAPTPSHQHDPLDNVRSSPGVISDDNSELPLPLPLPLSKPGPKRQMRLVGVRKKDGAETSLSLNPAAHNGREAGPDQDEPGQRKRRKTAKRTPTGVSSEAAEPSPSGARTRASTGTGRKRVGKGHSRAQSVGLVAGPEKRSVVIPYSKDGPAGQIIDQLLLGKPLDQAGANASPEEAPAKPPAAAAPAIPKPTHPFFSLSQKGPTEPAEKADDGASERTTAEGPLLSQHPPFSFSSVMLQQKPAEFTSSLVRDRLLPRSKDTREAPFPSQGFVHIRGEETVPSCLVPGNCPLERIRTRPGPRRASRAYVPPQEDILASRASERDICKNKPSVVLAQSRTTVRLADRCVTTGRQVRQEISNRCTSKALHKTDDGYGWPHLQNLQLELDDALSALDCGRREGQSWCKKYAPKKHSEVLQPNIEMEILLSWLKGKVVQSVGSSAPGRQSKKAAKEADKSKRKRRKADDDFGGFVVDEEEEGEESDFGEVDISRTDRVGWVDTRRGAQPSLIWHSVGRPKKADRNSILISGPHGCGKTAAVYAVANELDFEVFEINAGSRRSGKDILDRIGNMVGNHLVQQVTRTLKIDSDETGRPAGVGSAGSVSSFFKPTSVQEAEKPSGKTEEAEKETKAVSQKQCLILFEEVDVLFEEDKQFWETVRTLVAYSRRPVIMTCSDERAVPVDTLELHSILRFAPAPTALAVDYLVTVAALEGHVLSAGSVSRLYQAKQLDLRASLTELNFWCQIGLGRSHGGIEWLFPGQALHQRQRTMSVNTYHPDLGWLSRDAVVAFQQGEPGSTERLVRDMVELNVDKEGICSSLLGVVSDAPAPSVGLDELALIAEVESDADLIGAAGCHESRKTSLDSRPPKHSETAKASLLVGHRHIRHEPVPNHHQPVGADIGHYIALQRRVAHPSPLDSRPHRPRSLAALPTDPLDAVYHARRLGRASPPLSRADFAALDPLADSSTISATGLLTISSLDREFGVLTHDIAPFVRSTIYHELSLKTDPAVPAHSAAVPSPPFLGPHYYSPYTVGSGPAGPVLVHTSAAGADGGGTARRTRRTRTSLCALEGVPRRAPARKSRLPEDLDCDAVLRTAGADWTQLYHRYMKAEWTRVHQRTYERMLADQAERARLAAQEQLQQQQLQRQQQQQQHEQLRQEQRGQVRQGQLPVALAPSTPVQASVAQPVGYSAYGGYMYPALAPFPPPPYPYPVGCHAPPPLTPVTPMTAATGGTAHAPNGHLPGGYPADSTRSLYVAVAAPFPAGGGPAADSAQLCSGLQPPPASSPSS